MFRLMISEDAGCNYYPFMTHKHSAKLIKRAKKKDIRWIRWYIEEEGKGLLNVICPTHKKSLEEIKLLYN